MYNAPMVGDTGGAGGVGDFINGNNQKIFTNFVSGWRQNYVHH